MGEVYEALDLSLGEPVALKTVRATMSDHPRAVESLKSEVLMARRVTHPNVCRIFDFGLHAPAGADAPLPFLTMELLTGVTLSARIRERRPLRPAEMIDISRQLAEGLHAAHGVKVIHKDLKPENVILIDDATDGLRAVLTDFGLAATRALVEASATTAPQFSGGTPGYVAPERLAGAPVTEASDVFSLGVVMTDMITGALPGERPARPASAPEVARAEGPLARLARRCQDPDARERPALHEVVRALQQLERPPGGPGRALRWGAATIGTLALVAGLAFGGSRDRSPAPPTGSEATSARGSNSASSPARDEPTAAIVAGATRELTSTPAAVPAPPPAPRPPASPPRRRRTATPAGGGDLAAQTLRAAVDRLGAGRIGEACALGQLAAEQAPRSPAVWEFMGGCYMRLPDPERARAAYRNYLELAPDAPRASLIRAMVEREPR